MTEIEGTWDEPKSPHKVNESPERGDLRHDEPLGFRLFLLFLHFQDGHTLISAAFRANAVRQAHRAALGAANQVNGWQSIMGAATVATALR